MRINGHELGRTRLCRAANCPDDATTYGRRARKRTECRACIRIRKQGYRDQAKAQAESETA